MYTYHLLELNLYVREQCVMGRVTLGGKNKSNFTLLG